MGAAESGPTPDPLGPVAVRELDNASEWAMHAAMDRTRRIAGAVGGALALGTGLLLATVFPLDAGGRASLPNVVVLAFLLGLGAIFLASAAFALGRDRWIARVELDEVRFRMHRFDGTVREVEWGAPDLDLTVAETVRPSAPPTGRRASGARLSLAGPQPLVGAPVTAEIATALVRQAREAGLRIRVEPDEAEPSQRPSVHERTSRIRAREDPTLPRTRPTVSAAASVPVPRRAPPVV